MGEAMDGIACLIDIVFQDNPGMPIDELEAHMNRVMQAKCEKWIAKYG